MSARLSFGISAKLAIASLVGLMALGGLAVNRQWDAHLRNDLSAGAKAGDQVQKQMLRASLGVRRVIIVSRDIRLSPDAAVLAETSGKVASFVKESRDALDLALSRASSADVTARLTKAKDLLSTFAAAVGDLAATQGEILSTRASLSEQGLAWSKDMGELLASSALAREDARELKHALERADFYSTSARLSAWAYFAQPNPDSPARIRAAFANTNRYLNASRELAEEASVAKAIDAFLAFAPRYQETIEKSLQATTRQVDLIRDRADPARTELDKLIDATNTELSDREAEIEAGLAAQESRSGAIDFALELVAFAALLGSAVFSMYHIARPIRRIADVLLELANGNKAVAIAYGERGDEVGEAARAAQTFKSNLERMEMLEAEQERTEQRAAVERKSQMQKLADGFEAAVGGIVEAVSTSATDLQRAAGTLTGTADTTQQLSATVATASENASANVSSVASATEQMTSSVNEISRQVQESSSIARQAVTQAQKTDARISALSQAAARIGDVVKLITAIAEQTNLLALNATIEAARAGEAGKGFAVVAAEVKSLANQTAKATDEIGTQIAGMQAATQESVGAIKEIGATIDRISQIASTIAASVEQQGAATQEIARNVQQAAHGTAQVAANIAEVNKSANETGGAAGQVLSSAQALSAEGGKLKTEVDKFLATVRAA
ncbi:MAG: methyl-accepting chemotaxis protein [Xanthobacteraceae bacterium]